MYFENLFVSIIYEKFFLPTQRMLLSQCISEIAIMSFSTTQDHCEFMVSTKAGNISNKIISLK